MQEVCNTTDSCPRSVCCSNLEQGYQSLGHYFDSVWTRRPRIERSFNLINSEIYSRSSVSCSFQGRLLLHTLMKSNFSCTPTLTRFTRASLANASPTLSSICLSSNVSCCSSCTEGFPSRSFTRKCGVWSSPLYTSPPTTMASAIRTLIV